MADETALSAPEVSWPAELRLSDYALAPQLVREGETLELRGRRIPDALHLCVAGLLAFLCTVAFRRVDARGGILESALFVSAFALAALLWIAGRIRIRFDGARKRVLIDRTWLGIWSKRDEIPFASLSEIDLRETQGPLRYCFVLTSAFGRATLGRFESGRQVAAVDRELQKLVFGVDNPVV